MGYIRMEIRLLIIVFNQLSEGTYTLSANYFIPNSSNVCIYSDTIELVDKEPLEFTYDLYNPTCYGTCDGSISYKSIEWWY